MAAASAPDTAPDYPAHWEADVVLADGATAHIRPISADDDKLLVDFYARVSDRSKYFRFFAPYPKLSARDVDYFTQVDQVGRVGLIMMLGGEMIGVGRYERLPGSTGDGGTQAEVSFLVQDDHQGRGVGSVLLEHLTQAARERGITRFVANVLPDNRRMFGVFADAGYEVANTFDDGVASVEFEISPTDHSLAVTAAREHRAEARSIERLLTPASVAVIGASRTKDKVGQVLVRNLLQGGFTGRVYAVNPSATAISGMPAYASVTDIPGDVDLALVAVPADAVRTVVEQCADRGVKGLVVVSSGFADTGEPAGRRRQDELVRLARANGIRVVGPNCLGVVNTDPAYALNASLASDLPPPGRVGFFSQSGALGTAILSDGAARGLGLSTFVSAGNRADVSGNDLLQYWRDDPATEVVLLYLESFGNPRKFFRLARRVSEDKPVVAVKSGRWIGMPDEALDAMFAQAGVIRADTIAELFDVAQVLAYQPLPAGRRVALIGNSDALCRLASHAAEMAGLDVRRTLDLGPNASAADYAAALDSVMKDGRDEGDDDDADSVVVMYTPTVDASSSDDVARVLADAASHTDKTIVTTFLGNRGIPEPLRALDDAGVATRSSIPSYPTPEEAVRVLGKVASYGEWRARQRSRPSPVPEISGIDQVAAREMVAKALSASPSGIDLTGEPLRELLAAYGMELTPSEGAGVGDGVAVTIGAMEDDAFGPLTWFGIAGAASELLGDRSYRIPPLTERDAALMVRDIRAAPMLLGYAGGIMADLTAIEDLLQRVSRLVDDFPEIRHAELNPVLVGEKGAAVADATVRITAPAPRTGWYTRRL